MFRLFILFALFAPLAGAQSVITAETRELGPRGHVEAGRLLLDHEKLRIDIGVKDGVVSGNSMIFRSADQILYHIDHQAKTYRKITRDSMASMGSRMQEMHAAMEKRMAGLPEDQRALVEKMIEQSMPAEPASLPGRVLTMTDEQQKIGGFDCVRYDVLFGGEKKVEIWGADPEKVGIAPEHFNIFKNMSAFYKDVFKAMQAWSGHAAEQDPIGDFGKLEHFPILVRMFKGNEVTRETVFKNLEHSRLPPGTFDPPPAYKKLNASPAS